MRPRIDLLTSQLVLAIDATGSVARAAPARDAGLA